MFKIFPVFWMLSGLTMLVPHFVFTLFLEKRNHFILRAVIGIILYSFAAYLTCFTDQWNERYYLLLHLGASLYLALCSKCKLKMIIYFNIWGIALYYFVFQILSFINALLKISYEPSFELYIIKLISILLLAILSAVIIRSILIKDVMSFPVNQIIISLLISIAIIAFNTITFSISADTGLVGCECGIDCNNDVFHDWYK